MGGESRVAPIPGIRRLRPVINTNEIAVFLTVNIAWKTVEKKINKTTCNPTTERKLPLIFLSSTSVFSIYTHYILI